MDSEYVYVLKYIWNDIEMLGVYKTLESAKSTAQIHNTRLTNNRRKLHWKDMDDNTGYFVNNVSVAISNRTNTYVFSITRYKVQD